MRFRISCSCISHVGNRRKNNQDNFFCMGQYREETLELMTDPIIGSWESSKDSVVGVFDGLGGEACGEIASFLAATEASKIVLTKTPTKDLLKFCERANEVICEYASKEEVGSMGTTAAVMAFTKKGIALCNIGDSKIFRFSQQQLEQLSVDHLAPAPFGRKPPLYQNLGISSSEMIISPHVAREEYRQGDCYLICSDGLTDMLSQEEIRDVFMTENYENVSQSLLEKALAKGGHDNITMIVCRIERIQNGLYERIIKRMRRDCTYAG